MGNGQVLIQTHDINVSSAYLQVLNKSELKWPKKTLGNDIFIPSRAANYS